MYAFKDKQPIPNNLLASGLYLQKICKTFNALQQSDDFIALVHHCLFDINALSHYFEREDSRIFIQGKYFM